MVQAGTPQALFEEPEHTFVGYFIGSPGMNLLPCTQADEGSVQMGGVKLPVEPHLLERARGQGDLQLGIRPEFLGCSNVQGPDSLPANIERVDDLGNYKIVTATLGEHTLKAKLSEDAQVVPGPGWLSFPAGNTKLYAGERIVR